VRLRPLLLTALAALIIAAQATAAPYRPIRIAAYYPWFPEGWTYAGVDPFTHYTPTIGFYDAGDPQVIAKQIRAMRWGRIEAATYSWWGNGSQTDQRLADHLAAGARTGFRWAVYYEAEGYGDPSVDDIRADLTYLRDTYAQSPGYLKVDNRFVVFVYGDANDGAGCEAAQRWSQANTVGAYVVHRSFSGYNGCTAYADGWHPYSSHRYEFDLGRFAYTISPGFYFAKDSVPSRARNLRTWTRSVRRMTASRAQFHYLISFNEWGEGTAIESASQWSSRSGFGRYLDVLHASPERP
jgi:glycosyl hydrolase family 99